MLLLHTNCALSIGTKWCILSLNPGDLPACGQDRGKQWDEWSGREIYDKSAACTAQERDLLNQHERAEFDFA